MSSLRKLKPIRYTAKNPLIPDGLVDGPFEVDNIIKTNRNILCCKYTDDRQYIAVGCSVGTIELFKTNTGEHYGTLFDRHYHSFAPITKILHRNALKQNKCIIASDVAGCIKCWNHESKKLVYSVQDERPILGLTYHPVEAEFLSLGDDGVISLWDENTRQVIHRFEESTNPSHKDGHNNKVFSACFHPHNTYEFVSGGWDRTVQFWDIRLPHSVRYISQVYICGDSLDIHKGGTDLLTCCYTKTENIVIYDYKTLRKKNIVPNQGIFSHLYAGKYVGYSFMCVGGSNFNVFRVIDLRTNRNVAVVNKLNGAVYDVDVADVLKREKRTKHFQIENVENLPKMIFCSNKTIYQIRPTVEPT